ncbi:MAG TPA: sugar ABC transporter permease [Alphaproteobacteria bacterium]|nr:sugar ABC transporter permease [Alphaproteobacteria bacterium]
MGSDRGQTLRASCQAATAWRFLAPALVALILAGGWPLIRTVWLSLTDAQLAGGVIAFVGLENYRWLLTDPDWWQAVLNTLVFATISVALETVLGVILALILDASFRGRSLVRAAIILPWAIPTVVSAKIWAWMLHDQFGIMNRVLLGIGAIDRPLAWTADPDLAMAAVIAVDVWKTTPFMALLALAALQLVPRHCYEAAWLDGVPPLRFFFKVTLPLIAPALAVAALFRFLDALRVFDLIYVLTSNSRSTATIAVYARQQMMEFRDLGYGSAAASLLFAIVTGATVLYLLVSYVRAREPRQ